MRIHSHSSLGAFENCPRQYWYQYIGKPDVERVDTVEAFLGSRVHETLETLYRLRLGGRVLSEAETLAEYEAAWAKAWSDDVRIVSHRLTAADYLRAGREALAAYHRRHAPFDASATLQLEKRVLLDLDGKGVHRMQGYVDRIARRGDGTYEIHDYKTSAHLPTQAEADADRQLALYQMGLEAMWDDVGAVDLIWHYVRFDKDLVSHRTPEQLQGVRESCIAVMDEIEARGKEEERFPTQPSRLCDWCAFRAICPATRHEVATAELPPARFKNDDGVKLVDRWAETVEKRKALEAEAGKLRVLEEDLRGDVELFALREGLETVAGSAYRAVVRKASGYEFPRAGSEERPEFDEALKAAGLWERVTVANHSLIASLLKKPDEIPPRAWKRLEKFLEPFERVTAKLVKKTDDE